MEIVLLIILSIILLIEIGNLICDIVDYKKEKDEKDIAMAMNEFEDNKK